MHQLSRGEFANVSEIGFDQMFAGVNSGLAEQHAFSVQEADEALRAMSDHNQIMYSDGMCYMI